MPPYGRPSQPWLNDRCPRRFARKCRPGDAGADDRRISTRAHERAAPAPAAMSRLMLKSAKRASLIENLRSLRGLGKMRVR